MTDDTAGPAIPGAPTATTVAANAAVLGHLDFSNEDDFADARRGLLAPLGPAGRILNPEGRTIWDLERFEALVAEERTETVNPSLWRQTQLLAIGGLFHVAGGIYQVRGADLSNIDFIESDHGVIVVDPLISEEAARAAYQLYCEHRGHRPVVAVIYTHSHIDHFGGVKGVIEEAAVERGEVQVIAPAGFVEAAISENVMAGNAMLRRSSYMYGQRLEVSQQGMVSNGLGLTTSSGTVGLIAPTIEITEPEQHLEIDGVEFTFMLAPDTEAPSEMLFYLPQWNALCSAEDATHVLHNLYSPRGTKTRDARAWCHYLNRTLELFGDAEVVFAQHHWPTWGNDRVRSFLCAQRDAYRFLHDQTLRLANQGLTMVEIAEQLDWPEDLGRHWCNRGYYGSVSHNVKAVYNFYLGYFDGNPAHLHPHPPEVQGRRYVELAGGPEALLAHAEGAFAQGDYRWVAEVVSHLVFADPSHQGARDLLARAFVQLGYAQENGVWRNFYLTGAKELLEPRPTGGGSPANARSMASSLSTEMLFDLLAIRLNPERSAGRRLRINFVFSDDADYVLELIHSVLHAHKGVTDDGAVATVTTSVSLLKAALTGQVQLLDELAKGTITITGDLEALLELFSMLDTPDPWFAIVEP